MKPKSACTSSSLKTSEDYLNGHEPEQTHHHVTVLMEFLYVCIYNGHSYYVLTKNYMKTLSKCKLASTHCHTVQCHMSQALRSTRILVARILLRRKGKVSLMSKINTDSKEIEKQLKKEISGDFLQAGKEILFIDSKVN